MEKRNRVTILIVIILIIMGAFSNVMAAEKTQLKVVQDAGERKYLENNSGYIDNKITKIDSQNGEVTVQLSLNNKNKESTNAQYENTEIYILISENDLADTEKTSEYIDYIETLASKVFASSSKCKIGIIGIQGPINDSTIDENGNKVTGENDESGAKGTENNAEIIAKLTNDTTELTNNLENANKGQTRYYINPQAAIRLAINSYSDNVNRILISLYDNVPITAIGVDNRIHVSFNSTQEAAAKEKLQTLVNETKSEILKLKDNNIDLIILRPGDEDFDIKAYNTSTGELLLEIDGSSYVKELYGTIENPTYGKMYSLNQESLEKIVTEDIYEDIIEEIGTSIKNIEIKNYFSKEILENFEVSTSNNNIDMTNLEKDGYITVKISSLEANASEIFEYVLTLKNMNNEELLNNEISIVSKIELTYQDTLGESKAVTTNSSPIIKLTNVEEIDNTINEKGNDTTVATGKLPNAGMKTTIIVSIIIIVLISLIILKKYSNYKDVK